MVASAVFSKAAGARGPDLDGSRFCRGRGSEGLVVNGSILVSSVEW